MRSTIKILLSFLFFLLTFLEASSGTEKNGMDTQYYENGKIKEHGYYLESNKTGPWIFFTEGGSMEKIVFYNDSGKVDKIIYNYETNYQYFLSAFLVLSVVLTVLLIKEKNKTAKLKLKNKE